MLQHLSERLKARDQIARLGQFRDLALTQVAVRHLGAPRLKAMANRMLRHRGTGQSIHRCRRVLQALTEVSPGDAEAWLTLALAWLDAPKAEVDQSNELEYALQHCVALDHLNIRAWYGLGMLEQHRGNRPAAERAYRTALEIEPGHVASQFRLQSIGAGDATSFKTAPIVDVTMTEVGEHKLLITSSTCAIVRGALRSSDVAGAGAQLMPFLKSQYALQPNIAPRLDKAPKSLRAEIDRLTAQILEQHSRPLPEADAPAGNPTVAAATINGICRCTAEISRRRCRCTRTTRLHAGRMTGRRFGFHSWRADPASLHRCARL